MVYIPRKKYHGTSGNDVLVSSAPYSYDNEIFYGYDGHDWINGGAGRDVMYGGTGSDTYIVDNAADVVVEYANQGWDAIRSSVSYTLPDNVEQLQLTGSAAIYGYGNNLNNDIYGNAAANELRGYGGDDWLDGGAGADAMQGGTENDTYIVDNAADVVFENANEGYDSVRSYVSYTLTDNVEALWLLGSAANGTGNALDNTFYGNSAVNVLEGGDGNDNFYAGAGNDTLVGGLGADTMRGESGHDKYYVDDPGDLVIELANAGIDTAYSSISYTLPDNVEFLWLLENGGAINGAGNDLPNHIQGNSYSNVLTAGKGNDTIDGDGGADTMIGGLDNDHYYVDHAGDVVIENAGAADGLADQVNASVSHTLAANVENLNLEDEGGAIDGTGNDLDNTIWGNAHSNVLMGGAGDDEIYGDGSFLPGYVGDILNGGDGNDFVHGAGGDDVVDGGAGDDVLIGGLGADVMTGGQGADHFYYTGYDLGLGVGGFAPAGTAPDQIVDFSAAQADKIDFSRVDANTATPYSDEAFTFIGGSAFTNVAGQLRFDGGYVEGDVNGDAVADFSVQVNVASMTEFDFIL